MGIGLCSRLFWVTFEWYCVWYFELVIQTSCYKATLSSRPPQLHTSAVVVSDSLGSFLTFLARIIYKESTMFLGDAAPLCHRKPSTNTTVNGNDS